MGCSLSLQSNGVATHSPDRESQDVHQLEKNDFSYSVAPTQALKDALLKHAIDSEDQKSNIPLFSLLLKQFVVVSMTAGAECLEIDECSVSIGVITGCNFIGVEPLTGTAVSRKRVNSKYKVYCWFAPLEILPNRMCLLTLLSVDQLQNMSSVEVVNAINRGHLGLYRILRFEFRRISNCLEARLMLGSNEVVLCRSQLNKENHTMVLFSQLSPEFALSNLHVDWKIGFYCDEATYSEIVTPALADMPGILETELWTTAEFVYKLDAPNQLFVVDLDYMEKCGTIESHLGMLYVTQLYKVPPRLLIFAGANTRKIMDRSFCDNFICAKIDKRNLVYYILVDIINVLSDFRLF